MLKSTYRKDAAQSEPESLPAGWTEHKAPTGHTYYYNAETKQSTYTKPVAESEADELLIDYNATAPDHVVQASIKVLDEFHKNNPQAERGQGNFRGGKSYQDRTRHHRHQDRPKSKAAIPNCEPWLLVKTKLGRRFVHNTETKESFWKFPQDVMMAVIEMDRLEWEAKKKADEKADEHEKGEPDKAPAQNSNTTHPDPAPGEPYDSDEYEEVEVTDDEGEGDTASKRPRTDENDAEAPPKPVEFDEDDIAWQLAEMDAEGYAEAEVDADMDVDFEYPFEDQDYIAAGEADEEGLPLTAEDSIALFRSLLDDNRTDPYSNFDALIEYGNAAVIDDPRWVSLPNMSSRRTEFANWSRDRVAELKAQQEAASAATKKKKKDPRVAYLNFLMDNATPKLYWPEFKRKYKKEAEMKDLNFPDRDREKLYREYVSKLKTNEPSRKREFRELLKSIPQGESWSRQTRLDDLPDALVRDLRFYLLRDRKMRDELVEAHIGSL